MHPGSGSNFYTSNVVTTSIGIPLQIRRTNSSDSTKYPIGIKVQAVWSEDGEWYLMQFVCVCAGFCVCINQ